MIITTKISMDLRRASYPGVVHAMQNDINTRAVELRLMDNGVAWVVPENVTLAVAYKKQDGTNGLYDTLPNGISAVTISGSVITATLAPQMLTVPGNVTMALILQDVDLNKLATFPILVTVSANPAADAVKSENYYKYATMEQVSNAVNEKLEKLNDTVAEVEEKLANGDFVGKNAYEYARDGGYTGSEEEFCKWLALDKTAAHNVIFPAGLKTTYPMGKVQLVNGMGTLVEPGGTLADFFKVFIDEKNPETVLPSVSLTFAQAKAYEVGWKLTPEYSASLNPGSYTYGPDTGVTVKENGWSAKDSNGKTTQTASGSFLEIQVTDGMSYTITAEAEYTDGATPVTNTGKEYPAGKITSDTASAVSGAVTGYRKTFYGTLTEKATLDSGKIRELDGKSTSALKNGSSFKVTVPVGALRVVIAYPATLRDLTSVKDDTLGMGIESGFEKTTVKVAGANDYNAVDYKVYVLDFANPNDTANTYTVTI